jgi:hypothetical protein
MLEYQELLIKLDKTIKLEEKMVNLMISLKKEDHLLLQIQLMLDIDYL